MSFKNDKELKEAMEKVLSQSSLKTMDETAKMLQNQIEKVVYGSYSPEVYEDTFEFLKAWEVKSAENAGAEVYYEPSDITTVSPPYHASVIDGESVTEILANWIFKGNSGGIFANGGWNKSRDAWKALDKEMTNRKFRSMYESAMTAVGIPWKRSTGSVTKTIED